MANLINWVISIREFLNGMFSCVNLVSDHVPIVIQNLIRKMLCRDPEKVRKSPIIIQK